MNAQTMKVRDLIMALSRYNENEKIYIMGTNVALEPSEYATWIYSYRTKDGRLILTAMEGDSEIVRERIYKMHRPSVWEEKGACPPDVKFLNLDAISNKKQETLEVPRALLNSARRSIELEWGLTENAKEMRKLLELPLEGSIDD